MIIVSSEIHLNVINTNKNTYSHLVMISDVVTEGTQRAGDAELAKGGEMAKEEKINYSGKRKKDRTDVKMTQNDKKIYPIGFGLVWAQTGLMCIMNIINTM